MRRAKLGDQASDTSHPCPPRPPPHRFQAEGGYVLYPQIGDRLDLLCPRARPPGPHSSPNYEFYKLYLVGGAQGRRCEAPPAPNLLLTCDRPDLDLRFTIKFQEYSPNLWGHEFRSHHDYYIIGTAGQRAGSSGKAPLGLRADKGATSGGVGARRGDGIGVALSTNFSLWFSSSHIGWNPGRPGELAGRCVPH